MGISPITAFQSPYILWKSVFYVTNVYKLYITLENNFIYKKLSLKLFVVEKHKYLSGENVVVFVKHSCYGVEYCQEDLGLEKNSVVVEKVQ